MAAEVESKWYDPIIHATLQVRDFELAGADVLPEDCATPQGFSVLLVLENSSEGEKVFAALPHGSQIGQ